MKIYVQFTDAFDGTIPTVMEQRIKFAFGLDGANFWGNFFPCDRIHPNDTIVYLFTEHQLKVLYYWWKTKLEGTDEDERKKLEYRRQKTFQAPKLRDDLRKNPEGKVLDNIRACYVKLNTSYQYELKRVFFRTPPQHVNNVDFFNGGFGGESLKTMTDELRKKAVNEMLLLMRQKIEQEFKGTVNKYTKWLRYLSEKLRDDSKFIVYCAELNPDCPFLSKPLSEKTTESS